MPSIGSPATDAPPWRGIASAVEWAGGAELEQLAHELEQISGQGDRIEEDRQAERTD